MKGEFETASHCDGKHEEIKASDWYQKHPQKARAFRCNKGPFTITAWVSNFPAVGDDERGLEIFNTAIHFHFSIWDDAFSLRGWWKSQSSQWTTDVNYERSLRAHANRVQLKNLQRCVVLGQATSSTPRQFDNLQKTGELYIPQQKVKYDGTSVSFIYLRTHKDRPVSIPNVCKVENHSAKLTSRWILNGSSSCNLGMCVLRNRACCKGWHAKNVLLAPSYQFGGIITVTLQICL